MISFKARCEWVRPNNGILQVLFTREAAVQDEHVLINVQMAPSQFQQGQHYLIEIRNV